NEPAGWLVGEISLEEKWRMVDRIRIRQQGYALVIAPDGTLVAHGDPDKKALVAQARNMSSHPLVARKDIDEAAVEYSEPGEPAQLAVAAKIDTLKWTVIVEQPTSEAYANASQLQRQLV